MPLMERYIRAAQRRLGFNLWFGQLGWTLLIAAGAWLLLGLADRLLGLDVPLRLAAAGLALAAVMASAIWWFFARPLRAEAAYVLDTAAGLHERVSTSLHCEDRDDPWSKAVRADAQNAVDRIILRQHVPLRRPVSIPYAVSGMLIAWLVVWLMPEADLFGRQAERREAAERQEQVERVGQTVQKSIQRIKALSLAELPANELRELEELASLDPDQLREAERGPDDVRREAIKKLQDASQNLRRRMGAGKFEAAEQFRRMMRGLKEPGPGNDPVSGLHRALARGDLKGAQKAIRELKQLLDEAEDLSPAQREALQQNLQSLASKLQQLAESDNFEQRLKDRNLTKEELQSELQARQEACLQCQSLASCLGGAASASAASAQGSPVDASAAEQLEAAEGMLSQMEALGSELEQLNAALDELQSCQGSLCEGWGEEYGGGQKGGGMGRFGQGEGNRAPTEGARVGLKRQRPPVQTTKGTYIGRWFVDGQQVRGESQAEYNEAVNAAVNAATEALENDRVPRQYQQAVKTYFDRLPARAAEPEEKQADE